MISRKCSLGSRETQLAAKGLARCRLTSACSRPRRAVRLSWSGRISSRAATADARSVRWPSETIPYITLPVFVPSLASVAVLEARNRDCKIGSVGAVRLDHPSSNHRNRLFKHRTSSNPRNVGPTLRQGVVADPTAGSDERSLEAIERWRSAHEHGDAGVFAIPIHEAVKCVYTTAAGITAEEFIESAYPVQGAGRDFRKVRVITAPAT